MKMLTYFSSCALIVASYLTVFSAQVGASSNNRVVQGVQADPNSYPWIAKVGTYLRGEDPVKTRVFFCGGSLISKRHVLTAAHCVSESAAKSQYLVSLGSHFREGDHSNEQRINVRNVVLHEQFIQKPQLIMNDVAVMVLQRPAEINNHVKTIELPKPESHYVGKLVTLAGWGYVKNILMQKPINPEQLQEAEFVVIGKDACEKKFENRGSVSIYQGMVCAVKPDEKDEAEPAMCNGDSGGPLMYRDKIASRWELVGLASWSRATKLPEGTNLCTTPDVYTDVSFYYYWIKEKTRNV